MQRDGICPEVLAPQDRQAPPPVERAGMERFRRAIEQRIEQRDERAWEAIGRHWHGLLLQWLHRHPAARPAPEYGPPESG